MDQLTVGPVAAALDIAHLLAMLQGVDQALVADGGVPEPQTGRGLANQLFA